VSRPDSAYLDGGWVPAAGGRLVVLDPATEQPVVQALDGSAETVTRAVAAARRSFDGGAWRAQDLASRTDVCEAVLAAIEDRVEELAWLGTLQMGCPITVSRAMVRAGAALFRAYVDGARSLTYTYLRRDSAGSSLVLREPVGVVGAITPWNGPLAAVLNKVLPALLTGCSVVLKPAPETPLEGGLLAEMFTAAGLPDGVLNVVPGGRAAGAALVTAAGVDKITFTGSTGTGRSVGESCGRLFRRQSLELGGKSAGIVLEDADLAEAVPQIVAGNFFNSGQACIAISRVLVPTARLDELTEALRAEAAALVVGDPRDERTQLGPLVTERQRERVEAHIASGREQGARLVLGGGRPAGLPTGWYVEPTLFTGVTNDMAIAQEEIFGPVLSVLTYDGEDDAVALANDSAYGLHGAVFTSDPEHGVAVARRLRAGSVAVNRSGLTPGTPYGGVKDSGVGREHGAEGVAAFLEYRSVVLPGELADRYEQAGVPLA
jgi:acyl-CoA reductase-like NAD-dependent aldehyde dehydrogenase